MPLESGCWNHKDRLIHLRAFIGSANVKVHSGSGMNADRQSFMTCLG